MARRSYPAIPRASINDDVRAITEILEIGLGIKGQALDKFLTWNDLLDKGLVQLLPDKIGSKGVTDNAIDKVPPDSDPPDLTEPPTPEGFSVVGGIDSIILIWDNPRALYSNHGYTEIWRHTSDNIANAIMIGTSDGQSYIDHIGLINEARYYWIRFVSDVGVTGPYNSATGSDATTAGVVAQILADAAVITSKMADAAVDNAKLADLAVDAAKLANGSVDLGGNKITGQLQGVNLADAAVNAAKLADLSVEAAKLADSSVTAQKIANLAVGTAAIANGAITNAKIANLAVDTAKIQDASITNAKIANLAVGSAAIANLAVGNAKIADLAVTDAKIANATITGAKIANATITGTLIAASTIAAANIVDSTITGAKIANSTITDSHISNLSADKITVGTLTGRTVQTAASGRRAVLTANTNDLRFYDASNQSLAWIGEATFSITVSPFTFNWTTSAFFGDSALRQIGVIGKGSVCGGWFVAPNTSSGASGVSGLSYGSGGMGVSGEAASGFGVRGNATTGAGVYGVATSGVVPVGVRASSPVWAFYGDSGDAKLVSGTWQTFTGAHEGLLAKNTAVDPGDILIDLSIAGQSSIIDVMCYNAPSSAVNQHAIGIFVKRGHLPEANGNIAKPTPLKDLSEAEYNALNDDYDLIEIAAVGEGMINVCDANGDIAAGDLLVTCAVPGKGAKQADDIVRSYTVARARESVTWANEPGTTKQIACIYLCG